MQRTKPAIVLMTITVVFSLFACGQGDWVKLNEQATEAFVDGRYEKSIELNRRALVIVEEAEGPTHRNTGEVVLLMALAFNELDKYAEAKPLFERFLDIETANSKAYPGDIAETRIALAEVSIHLAQYAEAKALLARTLEDLKAALGEDNARVESLQVRIDELYKKIDKEESQAL